MEKATIIAPIKAQFQPKDFTLIEGQITSSEKISEDYDPILFKLGFTHLLKIEARYPVKLMQEILQKFAELWDCENSIPEGYSNLLQFIDPIYLSAFTWVTQRLMAEEEKKFKENGELSELMKAHVKMAKLHDLCNRHYAEIMGHNLLGFTPNTKKDVFDKFMERFTQLNALELPN